MLTLKFIAALSLWAAAVWIAKNYRAIYLDAYFEAKQLCFKGTELDELAANCDQIPRRRGIRKAIVDIQHYGWNAQDTRDAFLRSLNEYDWDELPSNPNAVIEEIRDV